MSHRHPFPVNLVSAALRAALCAALCSGLLATGCASEVTSAAQPTGPREIQLAIDQGVVFTVGDVVTSASYLKVDLIVRKHGTSNFDLKAGGSGPSDIMQMNTFKTGGVRKVFDSLADVPTTFPSSANYGEYVNNVKTGNGFVIANNIGDGHTKVWVKQVIASAGVVRLIFEPVQK